MEIQRKIWDFCKANGMTDAGAAAVLGNIEAESAFKASNVEDRCPISDAEYTAAVDIGNYNADLFTKDAYGYGLCQWTYPPRKARLYALAQDMGVSIADADMQLELLLAELKVDYPVLLKRLCAENDVKVLAAEFMIQFENPANKSIAAQYGRANMAMKWYDKYAHSYAATDNNVGNKVTYKTIEVKTIELCIGIEHRAVNALQVLLNAWGSQLDVDGIFGAQTKDAVTAFQRKNGLDADGIVGKDTWSKLLGG